jgi:hypothetical protein
MSNKDLFKEAIADAKAVREAALANAKAALEEALAPKLQSMLAAKLQEMDNEDLDEAEDKEEVEEGFYPEVTGDFGQDAERAKGFALEEGDEDELDENFDLSSILAELSKSDDELDEAKDKEEMDEAKKKEDLDEADEAEEDEEEEEESEEDESESDDKITDLTVDELKDIIKDIISAEMGGGEEMPADDMGLEMGDEEGGEVEDVAVSLDGGEEIAGEEEELDEIDLEELLAELDSLDEADDDKDDMYEAKKKDDKKKEDKDEMKEAIDTIEALRNELNEVNLLNAKLLYVNKIFKAKNLNESQKLKVIAQFDKATTAQEAKTIFESMNSAIEKSKKSIVKESLGFASKAAGIAPKKPIVEVDATISRWQMLAGIK